jgi:hypothetical protein
MEAAQGWDVHERVIATLEGRKPDRFPFVDLLEPWYDARKRANALPPEFDGLELGAVHRALRFGQQRFVRVYSWRLRGVDLTVTLDGDVVLRERDPVTNRFPQMLDYVDRSKAGVTTLALVTPVGEVRMRQELRQEAVEQGLQSYLAEHLIKSSADVRPVEYILEHMEFVLNRDLYMAEVASVGQGGLVVPSLDRLPYQQLLIDYFGEIEFIYALHDEPKMVEGLMQLLHERVSEAFAGLAGIDAPYVELIDNMTGAITSPPAFERYCLPHYDVYTTLLHRQGKKVGSHLDGDLRPLLGLIADSGLDVCESFSPEPLTPCTFEQAWEAWQYGGPTIWGGIPSTFLDERTPEEDLHDYMDRILSIVGSEPIIFGIVDHVMRDNIAERIRYIADRIESHTLS